MLKFYKCNVCGNIIELISNQGGQLVCCSKEMERLIPSTLDEGKEKHVPYVIGKMCKVNIRVGKDIHPHEPNHYIKFIIVETTQRVIRFNLTYNDVPSVNLRLERGEEIKAVYEYCSLHGLWMKDIDS